MFIAVMVIGLVTVAITNIRRADLKAASGMMAGAMRYLYSLAVINNQPYRLVIDMEEGKFWGEELNNEDPCARYLPEDDGPIDSVDTIAPAPEAPKPEEDAPMGIEARAEQPQGGGRAGYSRTKDNLLSTRELPPGIVVTGVITSHHRSAQNEGKAAIHFFPGGYAERAMVWLGEKPNPEEDAEPEVTLALDGLMGRVTRHQEALDAGEFVRESEP